MKEIYYQTLYEDENLIVINKNYGILTIPDRYNRNLPSLYSKLKKIYEQVFIVHRLDRDTSGVMLFAKDAETHRELSIGFENSEIIRKYHVVVDGIINQENLEIDIPLKASNKRLGMTVPSAKGKESLTLVKVLDRYRNQTLLECELKTGRHHQIRVHLQTIGFPLLVDDLYGTHNEFLLSSIKKRVNLKKGTDEKPVIERLSMHSHHIEFTHPIKKDIMSFTAEYPRDFSALVQILKKYS
jgi:RluA family pseudouridine synthase